jgi:hypothetical protein
MPSILVSQAGGFCVLGRPDWKCTLEGIKRHQKNAPAPPPGKRYRIATRSLPGFDVSTWLGGGAIEVTPGPCQSRQPKVQNRVDPAKSAIRGQF